MRAAALLVLAAVAVSAKDVPRPTTETGWPVHFLLSNQSIRQPTADLRLSVAGHVIGQSALPVAAQHHYRGLDARLACDACELEVLETHSGTRTVLQFDVGGETWVRVLFIDAWGGGHRIQVDTSRAPMAVK